MYLLGFILSLILYLKVEFVSTKKSEEKRRNVGLLTIKTQKESRPYTVKGVMEPNSDRQLSVDEAVAEGILDMKNGIYRNKEENADMSLGDALDSGLLIVEFDAEAATTEAEIITKSYVIYAAIDQKNRKRVPYDEAIRRKLLDAEKGVYNNNKTGEEMYVGDAIRKGFIKAAVIKDPSKMDIPQENKVVLDKMKSMRDKLIKPMKAVSALKRAGTTEGAAADGQ